jgi:hypothetical protein
LLNFIVGDLTAGGRGRQQKFVRTIYKICATSIIQRDLPERWLLKVLIPARSVKSARLLPPKKADLRLLPNAAIGSAGGCSYPLYPHCGSASGCDPASDDYRLKWDAGHGIDTIQNPSKCPAVKRGD